VTQDDPAARHRPARRLLHPAIVLGAAVMAMPGGAHAFLPAFDQPATLVAQERVAPGTQLIPSGPWTPAGLPARRVEGVVEQTAWRVEAPGTETLALLAPLRQALQDDGWQIVYECGTEDCGGFDFRFALDVLPEPEMHVDLGDFRFVAAERPDRNQTIALLVSRSARAGFVQVTRVGPEGSAPQVTASTRSPDAAVAGPGAAVAVAPAPVTPDDAVQFGAALARGAVALEDIAFGTNATVVQQPGAASLVTLAAYLAANPGHRVAIVGHTDAEGSLDGNVALSERRAQAVRASLIADHGVDPAQVTAAGVGFLAPRASNQTADGRARNRRVEVMLTATK
jgi:OOP family OmpA-OmpF porin